MIYEIIDGNLLEYGINRGKVLNKTKDELINIINANNEYFEKENEKKDMNYEDDIEDLKIDLNDRDEEIWCANEEIERLESDLEDMMEERDNYKLNNTYKVIREDGVYFVAIINVKNKDKYKFIDITKGHVCDCEFNSVEEAVDDLRKYKRKGKIINYFRM